MTINNTSKSETISIRNHIIGIMSQIKRRPIAIINAAIIGIFAITAIGFGSIEIARIIIANII